MSLTAEKKRELVVSKLKSRERKNKYKQDTNLRTKVATGFGDCSSTVEWAYREAINIEIGGYTPAQYANKKAIDVDYYDKGLCPNIDNLKKGDLIFWAGNFSSDRKKYDYVGHVEMYIGNGRIMGHGSGTGPTDKDLKEYCKYRGSKKHYLKARRFILGDDDKNLNVKEAELSRFLIDENEKDTSNKDNSQDNNEEQRNFKTWKYW